MPKGLEFQLIEPLVRKKFPALTGMLNFIDKGGPGSVVIDPDLLAQYLGNHQLREIQLGLPQGRGASPEQIRECIILHLAGNPNKRVSAVISSQKPEDTMRTMRSAWKDLFTPFSAGGHAKKQVNDSEGKQVDEYDLWSESPWSDLILSLYAKRQSLGLSHSSGTSSYLGRVADLLRNINTPKDSEKSKTKIIAYTKEEINHAARALSSLPDEFVLSVPEYNPELHDSSADDLIVDDLGELKDQENTALRKIENLIFNNSIIQGGSNTNPKDILANLTAWGDLLDPQKFLQITNFQNFEIPPAKLVEDFSKRGINSAEEWVLTLSNYMGLRQIIDKPIPEGEAYISLDTNANKRFDAFLPNKDRYPYLKLMFSNEPKLQADFVYLLTRLEVNLLDKNKKRYIFPDLINIQGNNRPTATRYKFSCPQWIVSVWGALVDLSRGFNSEKNRQIFLDNDENITGGNPVLDEILEQGTANGSLIVSTDNDIDGRSILSAVDDWMNNADNPRTRDQRIVDILNKEFPQPCVQYFFVYIWHTKSLPRLRNQYLRLLREQATYSENNPKHLAIRNRSLESIRKLGEVFMTKIVTRLGNKT